MTMIEERSDPVWRMLNPRSVALVGASDSNEALKLLVTDGVARGLRFSLVNPRHDEVYGQRAYASLSDIEEPVDLVLSRVSAAASTEVVAQAAAIGASGVVILAAQFAESGDEGAARQRAIVDEARRAGMAVLGPNCLGYYNVAENIRMTSAPMPEVRTGRVAFVAQSGGMLTSLFFGLAERRIGLTYAISSGNEAVTDMCDLIGVLLDDERTDAIGLVIEEVRRPREFLELAHRARTLGKAIIAVKMGRSERGQRIAQSHTGALMQDAGAYDAAFKQCGVGIARDVDDMLDQLQLFAHWPRERWHGGNRVAVVTASGGSAGLVSDAFERHGLPLVEDPKVVEFVKENIVGATVSNPLDVTGKNWNSTSLERIYTQYLASDAYDTLMVLGYLDEQQEGFAQSMVEPLRKAVPLTDKRLMMVSSETVRIGQWVDAALLSEGVAVGRGVPQTLRSLKAMDRYVLSRNRARLEATSEPVTAPIPRSVDTDAGRLAQFEDTMGFLDQFGIPVAPHAMWPATSEQLDRLADYSGRDLFVVKLANVLHRTDNKAVHLGVERTEVDSAASALRELARREGIPDDVVIQGQLDILGEVFIGIKSRSVFGPVVLVGIGGIFLEILNDSTSRLAPFGPDEAAEMLSELTGAAVLHGARGAEPWHPEELAHILARASMLAVATSSWMETLDINPLVVRRDGLAAVDGSCLLTPDAIATSEVDEGGRQ